MERMAALSGIPMLFLRAVCTVCLFFLSFSSLLAGHNTNSSPDVRAGRRRFDIRYLASVLVLGTLGAASSVQAGLFCSDPQFAVGTAPDIKYVIDGNVTYPIPIPTQITIDTFCTFQNFPASNPLKVTLNFQTNDPTIYLIIFDNVVFDGNLACSNIDHKLWIVNSPIDAFKSSCQDIIIPPETIAKQSATTTASIGVPFTYRLTLPYMLFPLADPSPNNLGNITLTDDLNATGADLSLVGTPVVTWASGGLVTHTFSNTAGVLSFGLPDVNAGEQIYIDITVVLNDTPGNTAGTQIINTANWTFSRLIDLDGTGPLPPQFFDPLPGEAGVADPITIAEPTLVVSKRSPDSAVNLGAMATFFIEVENVGGADAWNVTVQDVLPNDVPDVSNTKFAGMCDHNPLLAPGITATIVDASNVLLRTLVSGIDYLASYTPSPSCMLSLTMLSSNAVIGPTETLIIEYQSQLDLDSTADALALTNVAGAVQWFSAQTNPRRNYSRTLTDGTPGDLNDHEASYSVITGLSGYFFQKTVINLTSGANPAATASAGDRLRYRLRLFNVDQTFTDLTLDDVLDPNLFDLSTFAMVTPETPDPVTGLLQIIPPNVNPGDELIYEFEINLRSTLVSATTVPNQAEINATEYETVPTGAPITMLSDDPFINGIAAPGDPADPTRVVIYSPGPLLKQKVQDTVTIGEEFSYIIKVPANPVNVPLYDVRITDVLGAPDLLQPSNVDLNFVSATVLSGGTWSLSNTSGSLTNITIEDLATGIDILANQQVELEIRVRLLNTLTNQAGLVFSNTATYTYNRTNGVVATQTDGEPGSSGDMTILEPNLVEVTKSANNLAPAIGDIVTYTITLRAETGANLSDVMDVVLTDNLDPGLVYAGNPSISTGSIGSVSENNTVGAPDISGDGSVATPQILYWALNSDVPADIDIAMGETITLSYDVRVLNSVLANQTLSNSVVAQWSGIDNLIGGERNGADGSGGLNDYITTPVVATVTTPNITVPVSKSRINDTYTAGDVRIGDIVEYEIRLSVPEASLGNLVLIDTLPQGLQFEYIVSINTNTGPIYSPMGQFSHADITVADVSLAGVASIEQSTVTWSFGAVTNVPNDGLNDDFVVVYRARVLNNVIPHTDLNTLLDNTVTMEYDTATARVSSIVSESITAEQPMLNVTKTAQSAGGFTVVNAGEVVTYTVDISNNGSAPAYDVVLQDTIPVGMRNGTPVITMVSSDLVSVAGYAPLTPSYDVPSGVATWNFDNGVDNGYMIPAGDTLRVMYRVTVDGVIAGGQTLSNAAVATQYYSLDNDSIPSMNPGAGTVTSIRETYGPSNIATVILYTPDPPTKVLNPVISEATIGEEVVYHIRVPGNPSYTTLHDVVVTDTLHPALQYIDATDVSGNGFSLNNTLVGNTVTMTIAQIPLGQQAVIAVRARVANNTSAAAGIPSVTNVASYSHAFSVGGIQQPALSSTVTGVDDSFSIIEPSLALLKNFSNVNSPGNPPTAGNVLRYSVTLTAQGGVAADDFSDVFDVTLTDTMSLGLVYQAGTATIGGVAINDPGVIGDGVLTPQVLTWSVVDSATDIDIVEGSFITVSYDVLVLDSVQIGQVLSNSAQAEWTSLNGVDPNERDGGGCPTTIVPPDDYCSSGTTSVTVPDNTVFAKDRLSDSFDPLDVNVRVGDIVEYELRMTLQEGTTPAVVLTDVLPQGLAFEGVVSINNNTVSPYTAMPPFSHSVITANANGNPLTGPTTVIFDIGNIINAGDNNAANDNFVIVYRARVLNDVLTQTASSSLMNTVDMNYTLLSGLVVTRSSSYNLTLLQPMLSVVKSAVPANGDTVLDAGEMVRYSVDIVNNGLAPAYDVVLQDIIPVGMRDGIASVTIVSSDLVPAAGYAPLAPLFDRATGIATWNFDNGTANAYNIPPNGGILRVIYDVQADADLGPDMSLTNSAQATLYYSFDDEEPATLGGIDGVRQQYGPTPTDTVTLTTDPPTALDKRNTQTTATFGVPFSYIVRVPATPMPTALNDVRIIDDLSASAASLSYVNVTRLAGSAGSQAVAWTPQNTGTAPVIVIEDSSNGIDIPAGEWIEIEITVQLNDVLANVEALPFTNSATYTYNRVNDDAATQGPSVGIDLSDTTVAMTIVSPYSLIMQKTGPPTMRLGLPATFYLDVRNAGTSTAWDLTITDLLPNPDPGGVCDVAPANITAQMYDDTAPTPVAVGAALTVNVDYTFTVIPGTFDCTLILSMLTPAAAIPVNYHLRISYDLQLDGDTVPSSSVTNIAAVTEWFSTDTNGAGAIGQTRTYSGLLSDGTETVADEQDLHTLITEVPTIRFQKTVENVTASQNPGVDANPGDTLRYTLTATNVSSSPLRDFSITDEFDRLNATPMFAAGSLNLTTIVVPSNADFSLSDPNGGSQATGLLVVSKLDLDAMGGANDSIQIIFEVNLAPVITSGTTVLNQAELLVSGLPPAPSDDPIVNGVDDPNIAGGEDPTPILIDSWPLFQIYKSSTDLTGSATELQAGDILRYTITVKNIGSEDAINASLSDQIPANTTYIAGSTTLNGVVVPDLAAATSALPGGIFINAPENTSAGYLRADATATTSNVASISFDVQVNADVLDGTILSNQALLDADGAGVSGPIPTQPSDDPVTAIVDDPTRDVVGNLPLIDSQKTVAIALDNNNDGSVDPGDILRYTITVTNYGAIPATGVRLQDDVPVDTSYVSDSVYLNSLAVGQPDNGVSPLIAGIDVSSSDLTPPLPAAGVGYLSPGATATITFDVMVNLLPAPVPFGTVISNQGLVYSNELAVEPTDADGLDSNGDQATLIVVGDVQQLAISKEVFLVGATQALAGGQLEYVVRVSNVGTVPATQVEIEDNLDFNLPGQMTYVPGSASLNGLNVGISYAAPILKADYSTTYGDLQPGAMLTLRFRVQLDAGLAIGTRVTNTGQVYWNNRGQTDMASVSIDIGGTPGVASLNGNIWHDSNFDDVFANGERAMAGWTVEVYFKNTRLGAVQTDSNGAYRVSGLAPNYQGTDRYELRYLAPGAGATSAKLGQASSVLAQVVSPFVDGLHYIGDIIVYSGNNLQNLNLPIEPNGVVYGSIARAPIVGARLTLLNAATNVALPASCFEDAAQQNQVTLADGYYKFDIRFGQAECSAGSDFIIAVDSTDPDYVGGVSVAIPPASSAAVPFSVPSCVGTATDAVATTANHCEVQSLAIQPPLSIAPRTAGTDYHLNVTLSDTQLPRDSQLFNNHIPLDPDLAEVIGISKVSSKVNVSRGDLVPYTISVNSTLLVPLTQISVIDTFPAGFKYVRGSARVNGVASEPIVSGLQLTWNVGTLAVNTQYRIELLLLVGAGAQEAEYVNRAVVSSSLLGNTSGVASATVRVVPDPTFDCSDVIGKVFDDKNLNGYQDPLESGIADVRLATATGLLVTTDAYGRFHITCAATPNEQRGSNFILKIDPRSLPSGYRITTENPRVLHLTRGKLSQFNFGATVHRVITLDVADGVFESDGSEMRRQWVHRLGLLMEQLRGKPSLLRIAYMADVEDSSLVTERLEKLKTRISEYWDKVNSYKLTIETEIYWRHGGPVSDGGLD